ncbi:unnamed protein product [Linum trigynum]|uniref:Secreted protein n=1 Tax=Linum trigynum TaxID=586398 RepID=A0AAV2FCB2_9ROSI
MIQLIVLFLVKCGLFPRCELRIISVEKQQATTNLPINQQWKLVAVVGGEAGSSSPSSPSWPVGIAARRRRQQKERPANTRRRRKVGRWLSGLCDFRLKKRLGGSGLGEVAASVVAVVAWESLLVAVVSRRERPANTRRREVGRWLCL